MVNRKLIEAQEQMRARIAAAEQNKNVSNIDPNKRPYSISDLMVLHNLSRATVIRLYQDEPDVEILKDRRPSRYGKRRYRTIRVPRYVYERVRLRMKNRQDI